jgi:hypothetical protein
VGAERSSKCISGVTGPLPHFVETFPDDGYMDMYQVMKTLREVGFSGAVEPDHVPRLAGDSGILARGRLTASRPCAPCCVGQMKRWDSFIEIDDLREAWLRSE